MEMYTYLQLNNDNFEYSDKHLWLSSWLYYSCLKWNFIYMHYFL